MPWTISLYSSNQTKNNLPKGSAIANSIENSNALNYLGEISIPSFKVLRWLNVSIYSGFLELAFVGDDVDLEYLDTLIRELQLMYLGKKDSSYNIPNCITVNDIDFLKNLRELISYNVDMYIYSIVN